MYRSDDGGQNWKWNGQGLEGESAFAENIFGIGQEIAALPGGEVLAISQNRSALYRLKPGAEKWEKVEAKLGGQPNEVAAGDNCFWVAVKGDGLYQVADGAAKRVWDGDVARVAADGERVAMGTFEGAYYSLDGGGKWTLAAGLPNRFWPVVALAGERLLAGTPGNGAFWMPLSPRGAQVEIAKSVAKQPVKIAAAPTQKLEQPFALTWTGKGVLEVENQNGAATLRAKNGAAQGSMSVELPRFDAQTWSGEVKIEGELSEALVALQSFDAAGKQIGWQTLADAKGQTNWTPFRAQAAWSAGATRVALVVLINGQGAVSTRALSAEAP